MTGLPKSPTRSPDWLALLNSSTISGFLVTSSTTAGFLRNLERSIPLGLFDGGAALDSGAGGGGGTLVDDVVSTGMTCTFELEDIIFGGGRILTEDGSIEFVGEEGDFIMVVVD